MRRYSPIPRGLLEALATPWREDTYRAFDGIFQGRRRYDCSNYLYRRDGDADPIGGFTFSEIADLVEASTLADASRVSASGFAVNEHAVHALADFCRDTYDAWRLCQERIAAAAEGKRLWQEARDAA